MLELMVTYRILYWQEVPVQIKAEGDDDEFSLQLPQRFMERVDHLAIQRGLQNADDYLQQWNWSDELEREGDSAETVAEAIKQELEAQANW
jgi:hypothetical protein